MFILFETISGVMFGFELGLDKEDPFYLVLDIGILRIFFLKGVNEE